MSECYIVSLTRPELAWACAAPEAGQPIILSKYTGKKDQVFVADGTTIRHKLSGLVVGYKTDIKKDVQLVLQPDNKGKGQQFFWKYNDRISTNNNLVLSAKNRTLEEGSEIVGAYLSVSDSQKFKLLGK